MMSYFRNTSKYVSSCVYNVRTSSRGGVGNHALIRNLNITATSTSPTTTRGTTTSPTTTTRGTTTSTTTTTRGTTTSPTTRSRWTTSTSPTRCLSAVSTNNCSRLDVVSRSSMCINRQQRALHLPTGLNPFKGSKRKEYSERRLLGYTMEQMYNVAADVDSYTEFVPWCKDARTSDHKNGQCKAHMTIGFPPLRESYIATVTLARPHLIKSVSTDGRMFNLLATTWKLSPGLEHIPQTSTLDFAVSFEFRSILHSNVAHIFFDEVVRSMVNAFLKRATHIYGPSSIRLQKPRILTYIS